MKEKLARQFELNAELDLENGKVTDVDLGGERNRDKDAEIAIWQNRVISILSRMTVDKRQYTTF